MRAFPLALLLTLPLAALAEDENPRPSVDKGKDVSPTAALKNFAVAPGLQVDVWAAEPLLANPVAFSFDQKGRAFVAETYRRRTSSPDIRRYMEWLLPDLALRTVEDRVALTMKLLAPELNLKPNSTHLDLNGDRQFDWRDWEVESERVKLVEDRAGQGVADTSSVFVEGFSSLVTGTGAGVLAVGDSVFYACVPDLWRMSGAGATQAATKEKLLTGFGVHVAYGGHDMHGLAQGPDGRIYWTIADCGAHVVTREGKTIATPDAGAVFRSNPDGSGMELFASGLRNPQSLAFNAVGDLFTGDNNADGGDKARWEHVVEGGDFGWRIGWQFLPKLGPWNAEKMWEMDLGGTALALLPPTGHLGHGPAGVAYYPGTGLPPAYRDHFFMADFPGGVRAFTLKKNGASYLVDLPAKVQLDNSPAEPQGKLLWGLSPSDVKFGVDGGAYVLDWVRGWDKTEQGRIYRVHAPAIDQSEEVAQTKKLLAEGMAGRSEDELIHLLPHPDMRVRLAAQFALAEKGENVMAKLLGAWTTPDGLPGDSVARLHCLWALGQIGRSVPRAFSEISTMLRDPGPEVRAQAAKLLGESNQPAQAARLLPLLGDPEPRVRFFAAQSLGKLRQPQAIAPLIDLLRTGVGGDAYLRHAAALALSQCADTPALTALARDADDNVRTGVLLALRRQHSPEVAAFLQDWNPQLVLEAARAIHDEPIPAALPVLASWAGQPKLAAPLARRAINAAYYVGTPAAAQTLAELAVHLQAREENRLDALEALAQWKTDLGRDRVIGLYRPLPATRAPEAAATALAPKIGPLLHDPVESLRIAAATAAGTLGLASAEGELVGLVAEPEGAPKVRLAALQALAAMSAPRLPEAIAAAAASKDQALAQEARKLESSHSPNEAFAQSVSLLEKGSPAEIAGAFQTLAPLAEPKVDALLLTWLDRLAAGKVPAAAQLELLEAAAQRAEPKVKARLAAYEKSRPEKDALARWRECLEGGDAAVGRQVFAEKAEAACMRCHKYAGVGGDVGPDLAGLGTRHDRAYILNSIVHPNAEIAPGYENVLLTLKDGNMVVGLLAAETAEEVTLKPLTGGDPQKVAKTTVAQRDKVPSPMPEGLGEILGKRDLRNVVEYLATGK